MLEPQLHYTLTCRRLVFQQVDILATAEYPDTPKFSPPPKIRRKNAAAVIDAKFLKFVSRRKEISAYLWPCFGFVCLLYTINTGNDVDATQLL